MSPLIYKRTPPLAASVVQCSMLKIWRLMLSIGFLFCLILDSEIPMILKLTLLDDNSVFNSEKWQNKEEIFRWRKFKLLLLFSGSFSSPGSQYSVQSCPLFTDIVLILLTNFILLDFFFSAALLNLIFLPFTVYINSSLFRLQNGRKSLVRMMQNHMGFFSFCRSLYVCLFILLHSQWTYVSQVSYWILWWFLATGRLQILQRKYIAIFLNP